MRIENEDLGKFITGEAINKRHEDSKERSKKVYSFAGKLIDEYGTEESGVRTRGIDDKLRKTPTVPLEINGKDYQLHLEEYTGSFGLDFRSVNYGGQVLFRLEPWGYPPKLGMETPLQGNEINLLSNLLGYIEIGLQAQTGAGQLKFSESI